MIIRSGKRSRYRSFTVGEKIAAVEASTNIDDRSSCLARRLELLERLDHRAGHRVAGDGHGVDALAGDRAPHLGGVELATEEHDAVALEREAPQAPLRGAVHQRRQVERRHARRRPSAAFLASVHSSATRSFV